ncbi:MAG: TIM barrel protein [Planctomycetes bacterium]|nr:TIM barrel protein [Planctomycetota bacterium]
MEICVFSKHLQDYGFEKLGKALRTIGVTGVDLTVREEGHVEPAEVADKLPEAVATLAAEGVRVSMITTGITSLDDDYAREVLETAAREGIRYYKFGYFYYGGFGTLRGLIDEARAKIRDLAAFSKELGIWGGYHNHCGDFLGACPSHIAEILTDADPEGAGAYFDIGHATIEGVKGGWLQGLDYLVDRVGMVVLKDFKFDFSGGENGGGTVPLGEGIVQWERFCKALHRIEDRVGPASIHAEYNLPADEVLRVAGRDKAFFDEIWQKTA